MASVIVTGDKEIDRKLATLKASVQRKIARPALTKQVRISAKAMKAEVPSRLKDAKRAIGFRVKLKGNEQVVAKAGAGVGVKKKKLDKFLEKQSKRRAGHAGVGISAADIHWFILGTGPRQTGSRKSGRTKKATGNPSHSTGIMPPQMPEVIKAGYRKSEKEAFNALIDESRKRIAELVK